MAETSSTSDLSTHWSDCWKSHHGCAVIRIKRLEVALIEVRNSLIGDLAIIDETLDDGTVTA